jgi:cytochrome P450
MTDIGAVLGKLEALKHDLSPAERAALDELLRAAEVTDTTPCQYNPFLPGVHADPYPRYHRIQAENPVHWSAAMAAWVITRYDDVVKAFRDPRLSYRTGFDVLMARVPPDQQEGVRSVSRFLASLLNEIDPPDHTRLRRIMTRALAAGGGRSAQRAARLEAVAHELVDAVEHDGEMDLVADFAYPLPNAVGADLLGVPHADRAWFAERIYDIVHTFSDGFNGTDAMRRGESAVEEVSEYLDRLLAERRVHPEGDVLSVLAANDEATPEERVLIAANIIMGLHENVTNAIALGVRALLEDDAELWSGLRAHPEQVPAVTEEILRYEVTAPILTRAAVEDIELGSVTIRKGERVILLLGAANRDAMRFEDPDRFVAERQPNAHIAFGVGRRACPGAALGRSILQAALTVLLERLPDLRLVDAEPAWREEINLRGLRSLPVAWG